jgi:thymidylate synthase
MTDSIDRQYHNILQQVLKNGEFLPGRNGNTLCVIAPPPMVIDSVDNYFPILSIRPMPFYKSALETLFFLSGKSNYSAMPEVLRNSWWEPWSDKARYSASWGKFYGYQLRHSQAEIGEFDQWQNLKKDLVESIKTGLVNRKMVISLWRRQDNLASHTKDPAVLDSCHSTCLCFNYNPISNTLSLHHTQRSLDLLCGTGADLVYSGLLMKVLQFEIEQLTGLRMNLGKLVFAPVNVHIYELHIELAKKLELFEPEQSPTVTINSIAENYIYKTIEEVKASLEIRGYSPAKSDYIFKLVG